MPIINRYQDISQIDKEAKRDYIDRHSPFVKCAQTAVKGKMFPVTVRMGNEYPHPDDNNHYIRNIQLFNGQTLLAESSFPPGTLGGEGAKGNAEVVFNIVPGGRKLSLTAMAYCTQHGLWESDPVVVTIAE